MLVLGVGLTLILRLTMSQVGAFLFGKLQNGARIMRQLFGISVDQHQERYKQTGLRFLWLFYRTNTIQTEEKAEIAARDGRKMDVSCNVIDGENPKR
jgi:hypothetical protein